MQDPDQYDWICDPLSAHHRRKSLLMPPHGFNNEAAASVKANGCILAGRGDRLPSAS